MKPLAILLMLVVLASLLGTAYLYTSCNVQVQQVQLLAQEASSQERTFSSLRQQIEHTSVQGILFDNTPLGEIEDYQFLTYQVTLSNTCYIPADMIEMQITPQNGDVLQIGDSTNHTLRARAQDTCSVTLLTSRESDPVREIQITYYLWGIPFYLRANYATR